MYTHFGCRLEVSNSFNFRNRNLSNIHPQLGYRGREVSSVVPSQCYCTRLNVLNSETKFL